MIWGLYTINTNLSSSSDRFFSSKCCCLFLHWFPKRISRFFRECVLSLLRGNIQSIKGHHVGKFCEEVRLVSPKKWAWKQRRNFLASERSIRLKKVRVLLLIKNFKKQWSSLISFLLLRTTKTSLRNQLRSTDLQIIELNKVPSTEWTRSNWENKRLFANADWPLDPILSCPGSKFSNWQSMFLDAAEKRVLLFQKLLNNCVVKAQLLHAFASLYLTLLLYLQLWSWAKARGS